MDTWSPEKQDVQAVETQRDVSFLFLAALLPVRRGWFAPVMLSSTLLESV